MTVYSLWLLALVGLSPSVLFGSRAPAAQLTVCHHHALSYLHRNQSAQIMAAGARFCFSANQNIHRIADKSAPADAQAPLFFTMTEDANGLKIAEKLSAELQASLATLPPTEIAPFLAKILTDEKPHRHCPRLALALVTNDQLFLGSLGQARIAISRNAPHIIANVYQHAEEETAIPPIHIVPFCHDDKLIVLAGRGITGALEADASGQKANAAIAAIVKEAFTTHKTCEAVATVVVDSAVAHMRYDDMSAVAICIPPRPRNTTSPTGVLLEPLIPAIPPVPPSTGATAEPSTMSLFAKYFICADK